MRLTVIMSVYNGEKYLARAIESILEQTFGGFEFLIFDDGSTDGTLAICNDFAERDARISVFADRDNRGSYTRLNRGLELARGEYVACMDSDDISLPTRFEKQLALLDSDPEIVLVGSRALIIDPDGDVLREMGSALTHEEIVDGLLSRSGQLVYHPSVMFRREAASRAGGYPTEFPYAEDLDLFLRLAETGKLVNIAEPLLMYREHFKKVGYLHWAQQEKVIDRILIEAHRRRGLEIDDRVLTNSRRQLRSKAQVHRTWAWWALSEGRVRTARKHAVRALMRQPWHLESARALYCSLRGY